MSITYTDSPERQLFNAVNHADLIAVRQLLSYGVNPDTVSPGRRTPMLQLALYRGHDELVPLLLQAKADPLQRDSYGRTALQAAQWVGNRSIAALLEGSHDRPERPGTETASLPADVLGRH